MRRRTYGHFKIVQQIDEVEYTQIFGQKKMGEKKWHSMVVSGPKLNWFSEFFTFKTFTRPKLLNWTLFGVD